MHEPTERPEHVGLGEWSNYDKVQSCLTKFYEGTMGRTVVLIKPNVAQRKSLNHLPGTLNPNLDLPLPHPTTGMLTFLRTMHQRTHICPFWIDWARNPHRVAVVAGASDSETTSAVAGAIPKQKEYVPLGGSAKNKDGKICRCGSATHLMSTSRLCPLNPNLRLGEAERLALYIHHKFTRYYDCEDGVRRSYKGRVVAVTPTNLGGGEMTHLLKILWFNGDEEDIEEQELLSIFKSMRKF